MLAWLEGRPSVTKVRNENREEGRAGPTVPEELERAI